MFAVYASCANHDNPLAALTIGERPAPDISEGWLRVKVSHASLNRHDIFTLRGITSHSQPLKFPMILGNDGAGTLDDGTPVVIYPLMGTADWRGDETLDPGWHVFSELRQGTMADYVVVPHRNAIPLPDGLSALDASVLGTAWLTAYRALFSKAKVQPGQTLLVQGASGGMSTALIQLGLAAGIEVWVTTRNDKGADLAASLGVEHIFLSGEDLPRRVDAVIDNVGAATMAHSLRSVRRGGVLVINGVTSGRSLEIELMRIFVEQIDVRGTIMGTLDEMMAMMNFIIAKAIKPVIGQVAPMTDAREAFKAMIDGRTHGKTVLTR